MATKSAECTRCGKVMPRTEEYFRKQSSAKSGLAADCKACNRERVREWRAAHPEKLRASQKRYSAENRFVLRERCRADHAKNRDKRLSARKARYPALRDATLAAHRKWYAANKDVAKAIVREWRNANPEICRQYHRNRKALVRGADGTHTAADIARLFAQQEGRCFYCSDALAKGFHVDHMTPVSRGGSNAPDNLCCACQFCNLSKHDSTAAEFLVKMERRSA